jgi:hypothetical protein
MLTQMWIDGQSKEAATGGEASRGRGGRRHLPLGGACSPYVALAMPHLGAVGGEAHHLMRVIVLVHYELSSPPDSRCRNPPALSLAGNAP